MNQQQVTISILNDFLIPHSNEELAGSKFTLPEFINFLKTKGRHYVQRLSANEVSSVVIAFNLKRKSNNLINQAVVLNIADTALSIRKKAIKLSYRDLLRTYCLHPDTIDALAFQDKATMRELELTQRLEQTRELINVCTGRRNLFSDAYLGVLTEKGITQELINEYLLEPILKVLRSEYHELVFSAGEPLTVAFRKITKTPREDDSPYYLANVNKYADIAALAE